MNSTKHNIITIALISMESEHVRFDFLFWRLFTLFFWTNKPKYSIWNLQAFFQSNLLSLFLFEWISRFIFLLLQRTTQFCSGTPKENVEQQWTTRIQNMFIMLTLYCCILLTFGSLTVKIQRINEITLCSRSGTKVTLQAE